MPDLCPNCLQRLSGDDTSSRNGHLKNITLFSESSSGGVYILEDFENGDSTPLKNCASARGTSTHQD